MCPISLFCYIRALYVRSEYRMTYSFSGRHHFYDIRNVFVAFVAGTRTPTNAYVELAMHIRSILPSNTDSYRFVILIHLIVNRDTYHITKFSLGLLK